MSEQKIVDKCPSCGSTGTLFIGKGGYLTCSLIGCPQPGVGRAIAKLRSDLAAQTAQAEEGKKWAQEYRKEAAYLYAEIAQLKGGRSIYEAKRLVKG